MIFIFDSRNYQYVFRAFIYLNIFHKSPLISKYVLSMGFIDSSRNLRYFSKRPPVNLGFYLGRFVLHLPKLLDLGIPGLLRTH